MNFDSYYFNYACKLNNEQDSNFNNKTFNNSVLQFKYQKPVLASDFQLIK